MVFIKVLDVAERYNELVEVMLDDCFYFCFRRGNKLNEVMFIDEDFNNSINYLMRLLKSLIILRKFFLSIIQFNDHVVVNSNFNKLNLTFARLSRDIIIKDLENCEGLKI